MRVLPKIAVVVLLLYASGAARAEMLSGSGSQGTIVRSAVPSVQPAVVSTSEIVGLALVTLPPEDKPKTHWPWWLRILAVIGVLVFIRVVAGSVRNKPTGPPPN